MRARIFIRCSMMIYAMVLVSACGISGGVKPIMPIEHAVTFYSVANKPAPTVVLMPGCGGVHFAADDGNRAPPIAKLLNDNGFNAVLLDYVKVVGLENICLGQLKPETLRKVLYAMLEYAYSQPFVDRDHFMLLGWSLGGSAALTAAQEIPPDVSPKIAAVAAYYPGCYKGLELSRRPTLLLMGLADNVVDPYECLALANRSPHTPLTIKTYWGAQHNFDNVDFKEPQSAHFLWMTFTSAYDAAAAADAEKSLLQFLRENSGAAAHQ